MGDKYRLRVLWLELLVTAAAVSGCRGDRAEQQRRMLQTEDRARARAERLEKVREFGPKGELLPSDLKLGGIVMPRGFEMKFTDPHDWTYDGNFPQVLVEEYFDRRLTHASAVKTELGELEFRGVREKSDPNMPAVRLRITPTPGRLDWTRIYIAEPAPMPQQVVADDAAARALMAERHRNAR